MKFYRDVLWMTVYQIPLTHVEPLENMAACGWGIFVRYTAVVQTSKIFLESALWIPMKIYRNVVWLTVCQIPLTHVDWSKTWLPVGGAFLSIYRAL